MSSNFSLRKNLKSYIPGMHGTEKTIKYRIVNWRGAGLKVLRQDKIILDK